MEGGNGVDVNVFFNEEVCLPDLFQLCPHDLFHSTKIYKRPCEKAHRPDLRKARNEYQEVENRMVCGRELEVVLRRVITDCRLKIDRLLEIFTETDAIAARAISVRNVTQTCETVEFSKAIKEKLKEVEGKLDVKQQAEVEHLRAQRVVLESKLLSEAFIKACGSVPPDAPIPIDCLDKEVPRICDVCGDLFSVYQSQNFVADHLGGKLHMGYMQIRETLAEFDAMTVVHKRKERKATLTYKRKERKATLTYQRRKRIKT